MLTNIPINNKNDNDYNGNNIDINKTAITSPIIAIITSTLLTIIIINGDDKKKA